MCYAGISSRTGGDPLRRSRCETGRTFDFDRQGMSIGATGLAGLRSLFERYNLVPARLSQTRQERQTRRNAEGARPVAVLKVVAKC